MLTVKRVVIEHFALMSLSKKQITLKILIQNPNCDIPKHFIRDPAAFNPDPMSATFLSPVLSISHMAGKTSGINVAIYI